MGFKMPLQKDAPPCIGPSDMVKKLQLKFKIHLESNGTYSVWYQEYSHYEKQWLQARCNIFYVLAFIIMWNDEILDLYNKYYADTKYSFTFPTQENAQGFIDEIESRILSAKLIT